MKRLLLLLIVALAAPLAIHAQTRSATGATPTAFVPAGYRVLPRGRATGDLNGDGRPDVVLALGPVAEATEAAPADENEAGLPPRLLLVLWRTATAYHLATVARRALLCRGCGGIYGDPFEGLGIEKGVLLVHHYGGSSWRWTLTARFRYQQGDFFQIGDTYNLYHNVTEPCSYLAGDHRPGDEHRDVNLLTGQYERLKVSEDCRLLENRRGRQPVQPLRRLTAYQPEP